MFHDHENMMENQLRWYALELLEIMKPGQAAENGQIKNEVKFC